MIGGISGPSACMNPPWDQFILSDTDIENLMSEFANTDRTEELIYSLHESYGVMEIRVISPGMAVTMDWRPSRVNIDVTETGIIERIYCG